MMFNQNQNLNNDNDESQGVEDVVQETPVEGVPMDTGGECAGDTLPAQVEEVPPPKARSKLRNTGRVNSKSQQPSNLGQILEETQVDVIKKMNDGGGWTNVQRAIALTERLNKSIADVRNVRTDVVNAGLKLREYLAVADRHWQQAMFKYRSLDGEHRSMVRANSQLVSRVEHLRALMEPTSAEASCIEELHTLREQNSLLNAELAAMAALVAKHESSQEDTTKACQLELKQLKQERDALLAKVKSLEQAKVKNNRGKRKRSQSQQEPALDEGPKKPKGQSDLEVPPGPGTIVGGSNVQCDQSAGKAETPAKSSDGDIRDSDLKVGNDTGEGTPEKKDTFVEVKHRKGRKPKFKRRSDAIAVSGSEESYATVLKTLRSNPDLEALGEDVKSVQRTRRNELLLILRKDAKHTSYEYSKLITDKGAITGTSARAICQEVNIRCKNLDETVKTEDLTKALQKQCNIGDTPIVVRWQKAHRGLLTATFKLPTAIAVEVLKVGKLKVNWSVCPLSRIEQPITCFKCWSFGHKSWTCKGPDRTKLCRRCGAEGHKIVGCTAAPKCLICKGDDCNHISGSTICPSYRRALETLKQCK